VDLQRGIIETIGRHLDGMSEEGLELLTLAAVLGKEFQLAELGVVSGLGPKDLLGRVDEAIRASVLFQTPKGPYGFTHVLVRDVLYKDLSTAARAALHRSVGERLLAHYGEATDAHVVDLADHFLRALPGGDVERAIDLGARAAEQETRLGRHKQAAKLWQRTAHAFAQLPRQDARRATVQLSLARSLVAAGRALEAREAFLDAAVLAQTFGRPQELAQAALGYAPLAEDAVAQRRALLEQALVGLAEGSDEAAGRLKTMVETALGGAP
jgi:predicted ATPase